MLVIHPDECIDCGLRRNCPPRRSTDTERGLEVLELNGHAKLAERNVKRDALPTEGVRGRPGNSMSFSADRQR